MRDSSPRTQKYLFQILCKASQIASKWLALGTVIMAKPALAQAIVVDSSTTTQLSGTNCAVNCTIIGGLRDGNGSGPSLFHSFSSFDIDRFASVTFTDPGVENIFSRVTGSTLSTIEGTLRVDGPANLFLLNPNGIVFGKNAQLDLQGSFLASTGDRIAFADNTAFSATDLSLPSLLTVNVPSGIQFGASPRPITLRGNGHRLAYSLSDNTVARSLPTTGLTVLNGVPNGAPNRPSAPNGRTLAFLGGDIVMRGANLTSSAGHIEVASLGSNAFVQFGPALFNSGSNSNLASSFDYTQSNVFQDIQLSQQSSIDVSGADAGSLRLQGQKINISEGSALLAQSLVGGGGQIFIRAEQSLTMTGVALSATEPMPTSAYVEIAPGAIGDGSSQLIVKAPNIALNSGAQIGLSLAGGGTAGSVDIDAQTITADGGSEATFSGIFSTVRPVFGLPFGRPLGAVGQGGSLNITTGQLRLSNGAQIAASTFGPGDAGDLTIQADQVEVLGFGPASSSGLDNPSRIVSASKVPVLGPPNLPPLLTRVSGNGGNIDIRTGRLTVADGGQISVSTNSSNSAGSLAISASESVELRGRTEEGRSGLFASSHIGTGAGGSIQVETGQLSLLAGATINASNFASTVSDFLPGSGAAGDIVLSADAITLKDGSLITTNTVSGDRANITLQSDNLILRRGSKITTNTTGTATSGNINIDTAALIALGDSDIAANTVNNSGGRIVVNAQTILGTAFRDQLTAESNITASSVLRPAFEGIVELNTTDASPIEGLFYLPAGFSSTDQIVAACEQAENNAFVATGRGGLPVNPSQLIADQSTWNDFRQIASADSFANSNNNRTRIAEYELVGTEETSQASRITLAEPIVEAQSWSLNDEGNVVLDTHVAASSTSAHSSRGCLINS